MHGVTSVMVTPTLWNQWGDKKSISHTGAHTHTHMQEVKNQPCQFVFDYKLPAMQPVAVEVFSLGAAVGL